LQYYAQQYLDTIVPNPKIVIKSYHKVPFRNYGIQSYPITGRKCSHRESLSLKVSMWSTSHF